ncbi:MAG: peptidoglycan D,D-transpeptidase FtsI family protein [Actinomycetota bacterium]
MQRQIKRVGLGLVAAFLAVFAQLNYLQIFAAERIAGNSANVRKILREYSIKRGDIVTSDGITVATSKATGGKLKYRRSYPEGDLFGHITGYYSLVYGTDRIERTYNDQLLGDSGVLSMQDIEDRLFDSGEQGEDVRLTINSELQQIARDSLGNQKGAVVALDPSTGAIKAMWSNPSYDPTPLAAHEAKTARSYYESLDPKTLTTPLLDKVTSRGYPPGSTFKVVTAAAALESGRYQRDSKFEDPDSIELPQTDRRLTNFTNTSCLGQGTIDLFTAMRVSCDTTFAIIGMEIHQQILEMSEALGFNDSIPLDVGTQPSSFPEIGDDNIPQRAYGGIGQGSVVATPLQMALVAAAVANDGVLLEPHMVEEVLDPSGAIVRRYEPEEMARPMSAETARILKEMMVAVVEDGTGTSAQIPGIEVGGKTGTAQTVEGASPHAWFIAFAPASNPKIAIAVLVENGGSYGSEATGGQVAAPIAKALMEADRRISGW